MNAQTWFALAFVIFLLLSETTAFQQMSRLPKSKGFLLYRTNSIAQRPCSCSSTYSCSCCEIVTLLHSKRQKTLCSNFTYEGDRLNVDISLDMDTIKSTTITTYRPFKICSAIPGTQFSSMCVNVIELNQFPRSLTVCVRHEIMDRIQEWRIDYTCVIISTDLPPNVTRKIPITSEETTTSMTTTKAATSATTMATSATSTMALATTTTGSTQPPTTEAQVSSTPSAMTPAKPAAPPASGPTPADAEELEDPTAIIGLRKKRRAKIYKFHKSNIVNNDRRTIVTNDRFNRPNNQTEIPNLNVTPPDGIIANKELPVFGEIERNVHHEDDEYFPSRIPPSVEKAIAQKKSVVNDKNDKTSYPEDSSKNRTTIVVFPD